MWQGLNQSVTSSANMLAQGSSSLMNTISNTSQNAVNAVQTTWNQPTPLGTAIQNAIGVLYSQSIALLTHLYQILVRQHFIYGLQEFLVGIIFMIVAGLVWYLIKYVNKETKWVKLDKQVATVVLGIVLSVSFIIGMNHIINSLPRLINPEYYAIQDSVRMIQEIRK